MAYKGTIDLILIVKFILAQKVTEGVQHVFCISNSTSEQTFSEYCVMVNCDVSIEP